MDQRLGTEYRVGAEFEIIKGHSEAGYAILKDVQFDELLVAEIIHHYFPRLVELHNYSPASSTKQKASNWLVIQNGECSTQSPNMLIITMPAVLTMQGLILHGLEQVIR